MDGATTTTVTGGALGLFWSTRLYYPYAGWGGWGWGWGTGGLLGGLFPFF